MINTHSLRQVNKRDRRKKIAVLFGLLAVILIGLTTMAGSAWGQTPAPLISIGLDQEVDQGQVAVVMQLFLLMTVLSLAPSILIMMTSFTRIVIVLAILRQAIGTVQTPSNQIVIGLALFMTMFIMSPVFERAWLDAVQPYMAEQLAPDIAIGNAIAPFREFMLGQIRESDLMLYMDIANVAPQTSVPDIPFSVLMPAFVTSELKTAFQIGFLLFIPFLIIDLIVASVLMSMGMMMLSPMMISLPFKLMLFVLVDGWALTLGTLASSFGI